jgi:hypothetical protein
MVAVVRDAADEPAAFVLGDDVGVDRGLGGDGKHRPAERGGDPCGQLLGTGGFQAVTST